jgi:hypothetical protein
MQYIHGRKTGEMLKIVKYMMVDSRMTEVCCEHERRKNQSKECKQSAGRQMERSDLVGYTDETI